MNQTIQLIDRNTLELNNVKKVASFNTEHFIIDTPFGQLKVTGKDLTIGKMDTTKQELTIKGTIDSLQYLSTSKESKEKSKSNILKKIFK